MAAAKPFSAFRWTSPRKQVTALIGPSGCGKSTLLRCLNRMNDLIDDVAITGNILLDGQEINDPALDVIELRRKVGMVFQKAVPFPKSIYENVAYGLRIAGVARSPGPGRGGGKEPAARGTVGRGQGSAARFGAGVFRGTAPAAVHCPGDCRQSGDHSDGRALFGVGPRSTTRIEDLIGELRGEYTIIIVTHNMQQAARVSDHTAFLYEGSLVEFGPTKRLFTRPEKHETEDYITGRFG